MILKIFHVINQSIFLDHNQLFFRKRLYYNIDHELMIVSHTKKKSMYRASYYYYYIFCPSFL